MVYRRIAYGPFYGLFALHFDEYREALTQAEVVERVEKAEGLFGLSTGKKFFVMNGAFPDDETPVDEASYIALMEVLKARGYFIIVESGGDYFPLHGREANMLIATVPSDGKWINFPCNAVVWTHEPKFAKEPVMLDHNRQVPKYMTYWHGVDWKVLLSVSKEAHYPWVMQEELPEEAVSL